MIVECGMSEGGSTMLAQLPPLSVENMTQVQLTEIIPQLVQLSTGRDHPLFGKNQFKPDWWPESIPWRKPQLDTTVQEEGQTELLRQVVRCCYKHLGQEDLLRMEELPLCAINQNVMSEEAPDSEQSEMKSMDSIEDTSKLVKSSCVEPMCESPTKSRMDLPSECDSEISTEPSENFVENTLEPAEEFSNVTVSGNVSESESENIVIHTFESAMATHSDDAEETVSEKVTEPSTNTAKEQITQNALQDELGVSRGEPVVEAPIWICFICAKQFEDQKSLMNHQDDCEKEMEIKETKQRLEALQREKEKLDKIRKSQTFMYKPRPRTIKMAPRRKSRKLKIEPYVPPPKSDFIQSLDLKEKPKAEKETVAEKEQIQSDCEIICIDDDDATPRTPRTPKSLMSQLSRDTETNHGRRRHLSFSGIVSDSESGEENVTQSPKTPTPAISSLLLAIDVTSALGKRLKKHLKIDSSIPIINNFERFCKGPHKNEFMEKLRQSDRPYPIVYKKRKKFSTKFVHHFKFNSSQRKEFMLTKRTGLTKRSRNLLCVLRDCSVKLKRLEPKVIKEWTRPKPKPALLFGRPWNCPSNMADPRLKQILSKPFYGPKSARIKQINENINRLRASHEMGGASSHYDMVTKYVTNPDGTETMKIMYRPKFVPVSSAPTFKFRGHQAGTQNRRKQIFERQKIKKSNDDDESNDDDDIQIIELSDSSDEEKDSMMSTLFCHSCTPQKKCPKHREPSYTWQSQHPGPNLARPLSNLNKPFVTNNPLRNIGQYRPLASTSRNTGIRSSTFSPHRWSGPRHFAHPGVQSAPIQHVSPPGALSMRDILAKPCPSPSASQKINYKYPHGASGGMQAPNLQRFPQNFKNPNVHSSPRQIMPGMLQANPKLLPHSVNGQTVRPNVVPSKPGMNPNILRKAPPPLHRKPISNKPQDAIVIDDDD